MVIGIYCCWNSLAGDRFPTMLLDTALKKKKKSSFTPLSAQKCHSASLFSPNTLLPLNFWLWIVFWLPSVHQSKSQFGEFKKKKLWKYFFFIKTIWNTVYFLAIFNIDSTKTKEKILLRKLFWKALFQYTYVFID